MYGEVTHDVFQLEGDPIILKSDGFPTYHLANVVDDHLMGITHVLRGEEWQASTPKHLLLYKAFGWSPPQFGHLPLIVNSDGSKLSKRQGELGIGSLRRRGYRPQAVLNLVTLVGGGFGDKEYSLERCLEVGQLVRSFQLGRVHTYPGRLELERLETLNRVALREGLADEERRRAMVVELVKVVKEEVERRGLEVDCLEELEVERLLVWGLQEGRVSKLGDFVGDQLLFLWAVPELSEPVKTPKSVICDVNEIVKTAKTFDKSLMKTLKKVGASENLKFPSFMTDLRIILTGCPEGLPVLEILHILGPTKSSRRLEQYTKP